MWRSTEVAPFDRAGIDALIAAEIPAVRLCGFATAHEVADLADALIERSVRTHSVPEVVRLGISQYEQGVKGTKRGYLEQAAALHHSFEAIFDAAGWRPLDRFIAALGDLGYEVDVMTEPDGARYWAGNGKLRSATTPIHVDTAAQDSRGWAVADAVAQLAWNLYLRVPDGAGLVEVWDRRWTPADDVHRGEHSYSFRPSVVKGAAKVAVAPVEGDVVLINSAAYHAVTECHGRLAYGSFISVFAGGRLRLWS